jgi:nicotinamide mononucleotide (NMN) deamidase PncC
MKSELELGRMYPDLLKTDYRIYIACAGAGAGIQQHLWAIPGISKVFAGACFPYAREDMIRFLGFEPEKFVSEKTAVAMAMESYSRALKEGHRAVGIGLTASVATKELHRGDHRIAVAYMTDTGCRVFSIILKKDKGFEARDWDGVVADNAGLYAISLATGCDLKALDRNYLGGHNIISWSLTNGEGDAEQLLRQYPVFGVGGRRYKVILDSAIFPGAFNPPHEAHKWIAKETGAVFAISTTTPHKGKLTVQDCLKRAVRSPDWELMFTFDDPYYTDKAIQFPNSTFVIGVDAFQRMLEPTWGQSPEQVFDILFENNISLVVVDRQIDGKIVTWSDKCPPAMLGLNITRLTLPAHLHGMSSTQIRNAKTNC